jgi:hypothetical protein
MLSFAGSDATSISGLVTNSTGAGISGVLVTLSGGNQPQTATTDASGYYTFVNPTTGVNYTVTPSKQNYTFSPTSLTFPNFSGNQRGNFIGTAAANPTYTIAGCGGYKRQQHQQRDAGAQ